MLMMSNVKPMEYLLSIGAYVFVFVWQVCCLYGITGEILPAGAVDVSAAECALRYSSSSSVIGALIGVVSDNQTAATGICRSCHAAYFLYSHAVNV